jgi:hypothetical protein
VTYAITRSRSGNDGEVQWDATRNSWLRASSPAAELVLIALRTQRGECLVDLTLGVDWAAVDKLRVDAQATARAVILAGLARYVTAGQIRDVTADVQVFSARGLLAFDVSFIDVQLGAQTRQRVRGER